MKLTRLSSSRRGRHLVIAVGAVIALSLILASAIFLRNLTRDFGESWPEVFFWQILVWLPWALFVLLLSDLKAGTGEMSHRWIRVFFYGLAGALVLVLHWAWFVWISSLFSPYLGAPETRLGAFRFFFVFWLLFDLVFLVAALLLLHLESEEASAVEVEAAAIQEDSEKQYVTVKQGGELRPVRLDQLHWAGSEDYYVRLHLASEEFLIRTSLRELEGELDPQRFVRIHRSTIVNVEQIESIEATRKGGTSVRLKDGTVRAASREGRRRLEERFKRLS